MVCNRVPHVSSTGARWAFDELWRRTGLPADVLHRVQVHYGDSVLFDCGTVSNESKVVRIYKTSPEAVGQLLNGSPSAVQWLDPGHVFPGKPFPVDEEFPVLFWGACLPGGAATLPVTASIRDGSTLEIYVDVIALCYFMLSRWEESVVPVRDVHGRFPGTASVAFKYGFLDRPIVDEYALMLREWLMVMFPQASVRTPTFRVQLSHDIDHLHTYSSRTRAMRGAAASVLRRDFFQTLRAARYIVTGKSQPGRYYFRVRWLMSVEQVKGFQDAAYYFKSCRPTAFDDGYDIREPSIRELVKELDRQGFEVGFHPSYNAFSDHELFIKEKTALEEVLGHRVKGGRQHYLRFAAPATWRSWESAGLTYDSTVGYADHEGFRCGTAHPFRCFDFEGDRVMDLVEYPLVAMDVTLRGYRRLGPQEFSRKLMELAWRVKRVRGVFTLLWHNSSFDYDWQPWGCMYQDILENLKKMIG